MKAQAAAFNKEMQRERGGVLRAMRGHGGAERPSIDKDLLQQQIAEEGLLKY